MITVSKDELAKQILFSKEAASYLGISLQRLNKLVQEGKLTPFKKNSSGTLFYLSDLEKRKKEISFFSEIKQEERSNGMFKIDTKVKQEALNFATLLNVLHDTEKTLDPLFSEFGKTTDLGLPINNPSIIEAYSNFFHISKNVLVHEYNKAFAAFRSLHATDEIIKRGSQDYPPLLVQTKQAPRFLYIRGRKTLLFEKRTVALVGSRQASQKAKDETFKLARVLGENGITIVSGLAKGIDVSAHQSALKHGVNTIAVIGTNLNQYYPIENEYVQKQIEKCGLVVSQFSPASKTERWFFPLRNGVMSGLSLATVIMEAGETSGALRQADFALKQGRQVLIPASALELKNITWPEKYIKRGAHVVHNSTEILEQLAESNIFKSGKSSPDQMSLFGSDTSERTDKEDDFMWSDSISMGKQ